MMKYSHRIFYKSVDLYHSQYVAHFEIVTWGLSAYENIILRYLL